MSTEPEDEVVEAEVEVDGEFTSSPDVEVEDDENGLSGQAHRHAGAAAAYAAAQHSAPPKPEPASSPQVDPNATAPSPQGEDAVADAVVDGEPSQSESTPTVESEIEELVAKAQKADEYLLLAQRTQADFENFKKRAKRDASLAQERGIAKLAKELLPAVDNLDRALQAAATYGTPAGTDAGGEVDDVGSAAVGANHETLLIDGLKLVQAEVLAALARVGIEPFSPVGEPFDPQHHEAVAQHRFEDKTPGTVVEVYQQGFRYGESVLRPARVLVAA